MDHLQCIDPTSLPRTKTFSWNVYFWYAFQMCSILCTSKGRRTKR